MICPLLVSSGVPLPVRASVIFFFLLSLIFFPSLAFFSSFPSLVGGWPTLCNACNAQQPSPEKSKLVSSRFASRGPQPAWAPGRGRRAAVGGAWNVVGQCKFHRAGGSMPLTWDRWSPSGKVPATCCRGPKRPSQRPTRAYKVPIATHPGPLSLACAMRQCIDSAASRAQSPLVGTSHYGCSSIASPPPGPHPYFPVPLVNCIRQLTITTTRTLAELSCNIILARDLENPGPRRWICLCRRSVSLSLSLPFCSHTLSLALGDTHAPPPCSSSTTLSLTHPPSPSLPSSTTY
jgi:hypothetical protein